MAAREGLAQGGGPRFTGTLEPGPCSSVRGWSILEIVITLSIIAIVGALAAPRMLKAVQGSKKKKAQSELSILASAINQLAWDTGKWPGGILDRSRSGSEINTEIWDLKSVASGLLTNDGRFPNWRGPYLDRMPLDPWGQSYFFDPDYTTKMGDVRIVVGSFGPNRRGQNEYDSDDIYVILQ